MRAGKGQDPAFPNPRSRRVRSGLRPCRGFCGLIWMSGMSRLGSEGALERCGMRDKSLIASREAFSKRCRIRSCREWSGKRGEQNLGGVKPWEFPDLERKVIFAWMIGVLIGFYFSSAQVWMLRCELRTGKSKIQSGKCQRERKHNFTSFFFYFQIRIITVIIILIIKAEIDTCAGTYQEIQIRNLSQKLQGPKALNSVHPKAQGRARTLLSGYPEEEKRGSHPGGANPSGAGRAKLQILVVINK